MKNIIVWILLLLPIAGFSQQEDNVKKGIKKEGAHEAEYNANSDVKDRSADVDSRNGETTAGDRKDAETTSKVNVEGTTNNQTDTRTTSSSGSPYTLMDDGERDGTNNRQSATLNIAGSPLPGHAKAMSSKGNQNKSNGEKPTAAQNNAATKKKG